MIKPCQHVLLVLALALAATSCTTKSAEVASPESIEIPSYSDGLQGQQVVTPAPNAPVATTQASDIAPTADDVGTGTEADPDPDDPRTPDAAAAAVPEVSEGALGALQEDSDEPQFGAMSELGQALGCADAAEIRRWFTTTAEAVVSAASDMPDQVWLCPSTDEVLADLDCFPAQTEDVLNALESEIGDAVADLVSQIRSANTVFCANGDVIRMGIDDLLDRADEAQANP